MIAPTATNGRHPPIPKNLGHSGKQLKPLASTLKQGDLYAHQASQAIKKIVKERPGISLATAFVVGGMLGWLIKRLG